MEPDPLKIALRFIVDSREDFNIVEDIEEGARSRKGLLLLSLTKGSAHCIRGNVFPCMSSRLKRRGYSCPLLACK